MQPGVHGYVFGSAEPEPELIRLAALARVYGRVTDAWLDAAGLEPGMTVADLGCGPGAVTLAVAETVTGGLLSARLSALDWAMETFRGANVAPRRGAEAAERLAVTAAAETRSEFGADVGLAAVAAVPSEGHPTGAVFLGMDIQGNIRVERVMLTPDRRRMREFSVISLLNLLRRTLSA